MENSEQTVQEKTPQSDIQFSPEDMLAIVKKEQEVKLLQCKAEIEAVLKKYGMTLRVGPPTMEIIPLSLLKAQEASVGVQK